MLRAALLGVLVLMLLLGAAIGFFNTQSVTLNYLLGSVQLPLIALILSELVLLALLGLLLFAARLWSLRLEIMSLRKRLAATETELKNLRSLTGAAES